MIENDKQLQIALDAIAAFEKMIDDVHRIDELPQAVRIAIRLVQLLVNVYTLPERTPAPSDNPDKER